MFYRGMGYVLRRWSSNMADMQPPRVCLQGLNLSLAARNRDRDPILARSNTSSPTDFPPLSISPTVEIRPDAFAGQPDNGQEERSKWFLQGHLQSFQLFSGTYPRLVSSTRSIFIDPEAVLIDSPQAPLSPSFSPQSSTLLTAQTTYHTRMPFSSALVPQL